MPLSFLSSLIGGGGGLGFTDSSSKSNTNTNQSFNTNTSGSTQRTLTPYQTQLQSPLFTAVMRAMTPEGAQATIAPFTAAARDATSSTYGGFADMLRQQFLGTGGGKSGKFGNALVQGNLQRLGALQGVDTAGQEQAAALPLQASQIAEQLLGLNFGETSTGTSSGTSTGTSSTKSSSSGFSL